MNEVMQEKDGLHRASIDPIGVKGPFSSKILEQSQKAQELGRLEG